MKNQERLDTLSWPVTRRQIDDTIIWGSEEIGKKAAYMIEFRSAACESGFILNPRIIIGQDLVDRVVIWNGLGYSIDDIRVPKQSVRRGLNQAGLHPHLLPVFDQALDTFSSSPALAVRSSDSETGAGTGQYKSAIVPNSFNGLREGLNTVMAGYYSDQACAFRREVEKTKGKSNAGFGIMIEPLIGQPLDGLDPKRKIFGPIISGFGFSSTPREPDGYLYTVPGFGCGVNTRYGEYITKKNFIKYSDNLEGYTSSQQRQILSGILPWRSSFLLNTVDKTFENNGIYKGQVLVVNPGEIDKKYGKSGEISESHINIPENTMYQISMNRVFDALDQLEDKIGYPCYAEWAITLKRAKQQLWLIQLGIIDNNTDLDPVDSLDWRKITFQALALQGTGIRQCSELVYVNQFGNLNRLAEYNRENEGYALIYSGEFSEVMGRKGGIRFEVLSNASVIIESSGGKHNSSPLGHWGGTMRETDKFFGTIRANEAYNALNDRMQSKQGIYVVPQPCCVYSSERQGVMALVIDENEK